MTSIFPHIGSCPLVGPKRVQDLAKVIQTLEHKSFMPPEHLMVINTMLTILGATLKAEYQCQISAINMVITFCGMEEEVAHGLCLREANIIILI
jgi:hypothetical protein